MPDSTRGTAGPTAIVGVGNLGSTLARLLVGGGESVLLASTDRASAHTLAEHLGPLARATSVDDAIAAADAVVLALWLDTIREVIPPRARLFESKVVVDPCNPVAFDAKGQAVRTLPSDQSAGSVVAPLLPSGAHYVKAFGTLRATDLAAGGNRQTRRAVLFYATDDDVATATIDRLIRAAGYDPVRAGGVADAGRIEGPGGDLHQIGLNGELIDLSEAERRVSRV